MDFLMIKIEYIVRNRFVNMSYRIGLLEFTSANKAIDYTRTVIEELGIGAIINSSHPKYQFFLDLINNHEDPPRKIGTGIAWFGIQRNKRDPKRLETFIQQTNGKKETFSWNNCSSQQWKTPEQKLFKALRTSIHSQIKEFRNNRREICAVCKQSVPCAVDHKDPTFKEIVDAFLAQVQIPVPSSFDKKNRTNEEIFQEKDKEFQTAWTDFHKEKAVLQFLCSTHHKEKTLHDIRQMH